MPFERPSLLTTARDLSLTGLDGRAQRRAVARGEVHRIKRGAYFPRPEWDALAPSTQHLVKVHATAESHPQAVFSHQSAAVLLGLPIVGPWPQEVQVSSDRATGGRSEPGIRRYCRGLRNDETTEVGELRVTSVSRTLVDLAIVMPFSHVMAAIDHALREQLVAKESVVEYLWTTGMFRGARRARRAITFGDPLSANAGESMSRAVIHELGFPPPLLQLKHPRAGGGADFADFEWPAYRVIGEFDGRIKYFDPAFMAGKSAPEVVYEEKRREDRLRAQSDGFARWNWDDAWRKDPLRILLLRAGLPLAR